MAFRSWYARRGWRSSRAGGRANCSFVRRGRRPSHRGFSTRCLLTRRAGVEACLQVRRNARPVRQLADADELEATKARAPHRGRALKSPHLPSPQITGSRKKTLRSSVNEADPVDVGSYAGDPTQTARSARRDDPVPHLPRQRPLR